MQGIMEIMLAFKILSQIFGPMCGVLKAGLIFSAMCSRPLALYTWRLEGLICRCICDKACPSVSLRQLVSWYCFCSGPPGQLPRTRNRWVDNNSWAYKFSHSNLPNFSQEGILRMFPPALSWFKAVKHGGTWQGCALLPIKFDWLTAAYSEHRSVRWRKVHTKCWEIDMAVFPPFAFSADVSHIPIYFKEKANPYMVTWHHACHTHYRRCI